MNLLINFYYIYLQKHGDKGLDASRTLLVIPLSFNFIAAFFFLTYFMKIYLFNVRLNSFLIGLPLMLIFGFTLMKYLDTHYINNPNSKFKDLKLSKPYYLFMPIHYLGSIFLFIISLKYS